MASQRWHRDGTRGNPDTLASTESSASRRDDVYGLEARLLFIGVLSWTGGVEAGLFSCPMIFILAVGSMHPKRFAYFPSAACAARQTGRLRHAKGCS